MREDDETTRRNRAPDETRTEGVLGDKATKVILVTGATGKQGGAAAARLLADGWRVRALTRDPASGAARRLAAAGAQVVEGDLDDRGSLDAAVEGVHGVFSVQQGALGAPPVPFDDEVRRGRHVADAAAAARVRHLVYASVAGVERGGGGRAFASKWAIEEHIRRVGIPATILRPVSFMENYADPAFGVQTGTLATPFAPDVPEQLIALEDIGAFVALAFADPARYSGTAVSIAGDALRPGQTAEALSLATGRDIRYLHVPVEVVRGQSEEVADVASFLNDRGGYGVDIAATRARYPGLTSFGTWLAGSGRVRLAELFEGTA
ncbi:NmrA family NAD(P)-binding protein [Parafrankia discariae]|uniref:NmrA family NAD(P)-binding protein n=1 Tax=Parafrankia discariae TaxID=365528 RepID=UPI00039E0456|nr:NmrA family NAD(P)-binding protein [Parafrankia discariae]